MNRVALVDFECVPTYETIRFAGTVDGNLFTLTPLSLPKGVVVPEVRVSVDQLLTQLQRCVEWSLEDAKPSRSMPELLALLHGVQKRPVSPSDIV